MKLKHLAMIAALLAAGWLSGCVPKSQLKKQYDLGLKDGHTEAIRGCAEEVYRLRADLKQKDDRLAKFNQLNEDGTLRERKKWKGDTWEEEVDGTESWQK